MSSLMDCAKGWHENDGSDTCERCGLDLNPPTRTHIEGTPCLIGPRDPRANSAFEGDMMIADDATWSRLDAEPDYAFADAGDCEFFCIVFDQKDQARCVQETKEFFA